MDNIVEERVVIGGETNIGATISYSDKSKKRPCSIVQGLGNMVQSAVLGTFFTLDFDIARAKC